MEGSITAADELGSGEWLAMMVDGSVAVPGATVEATGSSTVNAGDDGAAPEFGAAKPVVPKEQLAPLEAM